MMSPRLRIPTPRLPGRFSSGCLGDFKLIVSRWRPRAHRARRAEDVKVPVQVQGVAETPDEDSAALAANLFEKGVLKIHEKFPHGMSDTLPRDNPDVLASMTRWAARQAYSSTNVILP